MLPLLPLDRRKKSELAELRYQTRRAGHSPARIWTLRGGRDRLRSVPSCPHGTGCHREKGGERLKGGGPREENWRQPQTDYCSCSHPLLLISWRRRGHPLPHLHFPLPPVLPYLCQRRLGHAEGRKEGSRCQVGRDRAMRTRTPTAWTAAGGPTRPPANTPSWPRPNRGWSTRPSRNRAEGVSCLTGRDIPRVGADGGSGGGAGKPLLFGPGFLDSPVSYRSWRAPSIETILEPPLGVNQYTQYGS